MALDAGGATPAAVVETGDTADAGAVPFMSSWTLARGPRVEKQQSKERMVKSREGGVDRSLADFGRMLFEQMTLRTDDWA